MAHHDELVDELKNAYAKYAKLWGFNAKGLPFGTRRDDAGGRHFEFFPDGKMAIAGIDRGQETYRFESYDMVCTLSLRHIGHSCSRRQ